MASTSGNEAVVAQLQSVSAKINQVEEEVKGVSANVVMADGASRQSLQGQLHSMQRRLAALEEQKTLLLQLSVGKVGDGAGTATELKMLGLLEVIANKISSMTNDHNDQWLCHKHRYTSSQATQLRDLGFKADLVDAYQCKVEEGKLRCMLLNEPFDYELVCGSHLFKYSWYADVADTLGFENINDLKNGLLLLKPLEEAFDNGYLVFTYDDDADQFTAHWLGDEKAKIAHFKSYPWKTNERLGEQAQNVLRQRFEDRSFKSVVEGKTLVFTSEHRPYKRCLSYQARKAVAAAVQLGRIQPSWVVGKKLQYHSSGATNIERYFKSIPAEGADPPHSDLEPESESA